ncbi:MAG: type II secretion system protein GspD [Balneolaceae bacterium]|nr:type II secretion system protein GspD [Balneolaceae bacterium]MBO6546177.1 type II secretion system protein GspD [Balneolaceae bacterium]MBO6648535.1 type II secretion system protein GspD [Balneolaceae bacterium]
MRVSIKIVVALLISLNSLSGYAQVSGDSTEITGRQEYISYLKSIIDSNKVQLNPESIPENLYQKVENLNVSNIDSRDFLRALGRQYDLNLIVDNAINRQVTLRLSDVSVIEVLIFVCQEYNLLLTQTGQVFRVREYNEPEPDPIIAEPIINYENEFLSVDLEEVELSVFTRELTQATGQNIIIRNGVRGTLSGYLNNVQFENGLNILLSNNGYSLREKDGIYIIDRLGFTGGEEGSGSNFWVSMENGMINLDVVNAPVTDVIREIGYQSDVNMITYGLPNTSITAKANDLTIDQALTYIFRGTEFTYRKEGEMYILGDKNTSGIASNKLIRLKHIRSDVIVELIPESIIQNASVQVIKEQNGLMVIGTNDVIVELENFIEQIDFPTPQIMIEALVVDVNTSDMYQLGLSLAQGGAPDSSFFNPFSILFGQGADQQGGLSVQGSGQDVNNAFLSGGNLFGVQNLGRMPQDFFFRIQALDQEGLVSVRSRPQISTLNGHTASIEIGTTQYFLLTSTTPLQSPNQIVTQESQRFESIEANVLLEITPWVSASGDVTVEVHPEFNTPVGSFNADIPPTINSRVLDSTVRLKDGETIILGGLIQESESENINKVPILGNIPLLGRLFRNKSTSLMKSELVIFITPHVFYGDGNDNARWNSLREELNIDN